jgi:hypothetical protein
MKAVGIFDRINRIGDGLFLGFWSAEAALVGVVAARDVEVGLVELVPPVLDLEMFRVESLS